MCVCVCVCVCVRQLDFFVKYVLAICPYKLACVLQRSYFTSTPRYTCFYC